MIRNKERNRIIIHGADANEAFKNKGINNEKIFNYSINFIAYTYIMCKG
jgi:hypothetical protein